MTHYDNALHMMELQGGSFIKALAELYCRADKTNKVRVRAAFDDYFQQYEHRFQQWNAQQQNSVIENRHRNAERIDRDLNALAEDDEHLQSLMDRDMD